MPLGFYSVLVDVRVLTPLREVQGAGGAGVDSLSAFSHEGSFRNGGLHFLKQRCAQDYGAFGGRLSYVNTKSVLKNSSGTVVLVVFWLPYRNSGFRLALEI